MRVYRIEFREYEYQLGVQGGDWFLTPVTVKHVMADNAPAGPGGRVTVGVPANGRDGFKGLRYERHKFLGVLIVRAIVYIVFSDDSDSLLKPDIFPSAAAKMIRENMNRAGICRR